MTLQVIVCDRALGTYKLFIFFLVAFVFPFGKTFAKKFYPKKMKLYFRAHRQIERVQLQGQTHP